MAAFCRYCGSPTEEKAAFCPKCGRKLAAGTAVPASAPQQVPPVKKVERAAAVEAPARFCPRCGKPMPAGARFCGSCGAQVGQEARLAPASEPARREAESRPARSRTVVVNPGPASASAQKPKTPPAGKKPRKKKLVPAVALILAVVLLFTGFVSPGFFRRKGKPGLPDVNVARPTSTPVRTDNGHGETGDPGQNGGAEAVSEAGFRTPPAIRDIEFNYAPQEIAEAPAVTMSVSAEEPRASSGGFAVDFGAFNAIGDDAFTVRTLPLLVNEEGGYFVRGFDLSLASGRDAFPMEVAVTVPREETDGDLVMFLTRDPETGENKEEYYEISPDGASYILYTTHFSGHVLVSEFGTGDQFLADVRNADVSRGSTRAALSSFYYTSWTPQDKRMMTPVGFSPYDLWKKVTDNFTTYLPSGFALMAAIDDRIRKTPEGELPKNADLGAVMLLGEAELRDQAKNTVDVVDLGNNIKSAVEEGNKILDQYALENVSPGLKTAAQGPELGSAAKVETPFGEYLGAITTCLGFYLTNKKVETELAQGKYNDEGEAVWDHLEDYAGTIAGVTGLFASYLATAAAGAALGTAAGAVSPWLALGAAVVGIGLFIHSKAKGTPPYHNVVGAEMNYRDYYLNGGSPRRFYYDEPSMAGSDYGDGATGSIKRLESLNVEQSEAFKQLLNEGGNRYFSVGGIPAEDTRDKKAEPEWCAVILALRDVLKDEPNKLGGAVVEFYQNYVQACWDIGDAGFLSFSRDAMRARGEGDRTAALPSGQGNDTEAAYKEALLQELFAEHQSMLFSLARQFEHEALLGMNQMIREELLPLLNTTMEFTVEDLSLSDPKDFKHSVYNATPQLTGVYQDYAAPDGSVFNDRRYCFDYPMSFCIKRENEYYTELDGPVFMPATNFSKDVRDFGSIVVGLSLVKGEYIDYFPNYDNFIPMLRDEKDGNVVFRCTYFNYLMMGAPTAIAFRDLTDYAERKDEIEDEIIDFVLPEPENGVMHINIRIGEPKDLESDDPSIFDYTWAVDARPYGYASGDLSIRFNEPDELWPWKAEVYLYLYREDRQADMASGNYDSMICFYNEWSYNAGTGILTISQPDEAAFRKWWDNQAQHNSWYYDPDYRNTIAVPDTITFKYSNQDLYEVDPDRIVIDKMVMTFGDRKYYCYGEWETDDWMEKPPSVPN